MSEDSKMTFNETTKMREWRNASGQLHRLDGPAQEGDYHKAWWKDGLRHRDDGPAIEWIHYDGGIDWRSWNVNKDYYLEGVRLSSKEEYEQKKGAKSGNEESLPKPAQPKSPPKFNI